MPTSSDMSDRSTHCTKKDFIVPVKCVDPITVIHITYEHYPRYYEQTVFESLIYLVRNARNIAFAYLRFVIIR